MENVTNIYKYYCSPLLIGTTGILKLKTFYMLDFSYVKYKFPKKQLTHFQRSILKISDKKVLYTCAHKLYIISS